MREINLAAIKGSPFRYHLKEAGVWAAICGRKPGKGGKRAGWYVYSAIPNMVGEHLCQQCDGASAAVGVKVVNGEVVAR